MFGKVCHFCLSTVSAWGMRSFYILYTRNRFLHLDYLFLGCNIAQSTHYMHAPILKAIEKPPWGRWDNTYGAIPQKMRYIQGGRCVDHLFVVNGKTSAVNRNITVAFYTFAYLRTIVECPFKMATLSTK